MVKWKDVQKKKASQQQICAHTRPCHQVVLWSRSRDELHHRIYSQQPIRGWEGQPAHVYGEIIHSSLVSLYNNYTQVT